jgi:tetratricopeptide (TPR) repeat protein
MPSPSVYKNWGIAEPEALANPPPHALAPMKKLTIKARVALLQLLTVLVCSQQMLAGQSGLERARGLVAKGSFKEAEMRLRQIIAADPNSVDAHILLGTALALEGVRSESLEQLTEAVQLRPNSANAHNKLGMALSRFLEVKPAGEEFEKALELDPNLVEAHVNLALILAQAGELGPAGEHLDRAIKLQGNSPAAAYSHYLRAKVWGAQNQNEKATAEFQKAAQLRPNYAEAWSDLGGMRRLALDNEGALQALERAVALKPDDALAQYRLGQLYLQDGRAIKAVKHLKQALSYAPDDRAILYNLMLALRRTGQSKEAKTIEERMAQLQHQTDQATEVGLTASGLNDEGIQLEKSGDIRGALAKYRAALDLDPTGFGFRLNYALALCRLNRWQDGVVELREVLRLDPDNGDAAKALYIAREQAKTQRGDVRKHP